MVYVAPPKGARGGKSGANKNGSKGNRGRGKEHDALASKADLLAKLTRQAEEHTRILERERAALGLPSRASPNGQQQHQQQQQAHGQHTAAGNGRNRRANYHVFTDQANKKVFDPRQIPGLGGGGGDATAAAGGRDRGLSIVAPDLPPDAEQTLNQTFPDSPNFYPGRVFAIPGTIPPAPNQPQLPKAEGGAEPIVVAPWGGPPHSGAGGGAGAMASGPSAPVPMGLPPMGVAQGNARGGGPMGLAPQLPPGAVAPGGFDAVAAGGDPRVMARMEAEARKEAYRRELEEQIRAKKKAKEAEERRRREEDAAWEARAAAAPQPWDPEARAARRGGGGEPLRDEYGRPMANLRRRGGGAGGEPGSPIGSPGPGQMGPNPPPPFLGPGMAVPFPGPGGSRLTVDIPGGGAAAFPHPHQGPGLGLAGGGGVGIPPLAFNGEGAGGGPLAAHPNHGPMLPLGVGPPLMSPPGLPLPPHHLPLQGFGPSGGGGIGGPYDGLPASAGSAPPLLLSPNSNGNIIPPVSPGNRRFMAAMNDLIAGPSDEQRRQKEMARQRLQMDLEEQIREKRERQARERAEMERQRLKEEAELKAFQDNLAAQRQAELHRQAGAGGPPPLSPPHQQRQQLLQRHESSGGGAGGGGGMMDGGRPPLPPRRHGKGGKIIDASWLDAHPPPPPAAAVLPPLSSSPPSAGPISPHAAAMFGRRASSGIADDELSSGGDAAGQPGYGAGGGGGGGPLSPGGAGGGGAAAPAALIRRGPSYDGAGGISVAGGAVAARAGNVTILLQQLQEEQSRMRGDFARQAAAMEKLANDASRALADRDEAWRELQRVRAAMAAAGGGGAGAAAGTVASSPFLESFGIGTVIVDTHLVPKTTNSIPDPLPKPLASEVLRRGRTDPGRLPSSGGDEGGIGGIGLGGGPLLSPVARHRGGGFSPGGGGDGFGGGLYGGGFGYGDLGPVQDPALGRNPNGGARRSGIPLPPGMFPARAAHARAAAPRIQSVYGYGFDSSPPKSRYNSFFGLEQGDPPGGARGGGGGGGLPLLGPRKPPPPKPPPSPAILRGDHLPSPVKQTRGGGAQSGGARARSGRPPVAAGGSATSATERPLRGRVASAAPLQSQRRSPPELPPVSRPPAAAAAGTAAAVAAPAVGPSSGSQMSQHSLESMQNVLQRGHEERLLRGLGSDDGSGSTGTTVEYVAEEVPASTRSVVRGPRSREPSLPGHTEMMSPGAAANYLGGGGAAAAASGGIESKGPRRSFYSDSIASYRSLLARPSTLAAPTDAAAGPVTAAAGGGVSDGDGLSSGIRDRRTSSTHAAGVSVAEEPGRRVRPTSSTGATAAAGVSSRGGDGSCGVPAAGVTRVDSAISAESAVTAGSHAAITTAGASSPCPSPELPLQRPVRAGRRPSTRQRVSASASADGTSPSAADGGGAAIAAMAAAAAADD